MEHFKDTEMTNFNFKMATSSARDQISKIRNEPQMPHIIPNL